MSQSSNRATRNVQIADHLWDLFEQMAKAVGSDRDGLINQAMFMLPKFIGVEATELDALTPIPAAAPVLLLASSDGRREKISTDRFVIGRGRHCDFVIDSGKVSREHAAIIREGADYFIEDLKSSNGTWFNKQRIARRQIQDGDQYLICNDQITFVFE